MRKLGLWLHFSWNEGLPISDMESTCLRSPTITKKDLNSAVIELDVVPEALLDFCSAQVGFAHTFGLIKDTLNNFGWNHLPSLSNDVDCEELWRYCSVELLHHQHVHWNFLLFKFQTWQLKTLLWLSHFLVDNGSKSSPPPEPGKGIEGRQAVLLLYNTRPTFWVLQLQVSEACKGMKTPTFKVPLS